MIPVSESHPYLPSLPKSVNAKVGQQLMSHLDNVGLSTASRMPDLSLTVLCGLQLGLFVIAGMLSGCQGVSTGVVVPVMVPPKVNFGDNIKELQISPFKGPPACARPLQSKLETLATNAEVYRRSIAGLEEATETLEVKATVETCTLRVGYGALNSVFSIWHMGKQVHQEVLNEETNRPGAPPDEVRGVLVDRVAADFAKVFLPTQKQELRVFRPVAAEDPGIIAAMNGNWTLAVEMWTRRLKEAPQDHRALYNRAIAYEASGQLPRAVKDYRQAVELRGDELYTQALARAERAMNSQKQVEVLKRNLQ